MKLLKILLLLLLPSTQDALGEQPPDIDLAIVNASIIDGTGAARYNGHIYVKKDKIIAIDKASDAIRQAKEIIHANGKTLTPGFIDLHSHGNPLTHGEFTNFIAMGVTTISLGQDGFSPSTEQLNHWIQNVHEHGITPNIVLFIGHGTLRILAGIREETELTDTQLQRMSTILNNNLPYVFGMSTGLEYSPALYARQDELLTLAKLVGGHDKLIMSHMRNEDDHAVIESLNELISQGEYARVHAAHLKSVYGKGAKRADEILKVIQNANDKGIQLTADVYPYSASYTTIAIVFPEWAKTNEQLAVAKKTRRVELETYIRNKVNSRNGPESTLFGTAPYTGKTLKQVAAEAGKPFEQVLIDDIGAEGVSAAYFVMNDALQTRLLSDPLVAIASDGSPISYHPRGHGTFAKVIEEFVFNRRLFSLEQAVHKISGFPARILPLPLRGTIREGHFADLLIFEPSQVSANADYINPHNLATGIDYVIINGEIVLANGQFKDSYPGKVLSPTTK